MTKNVFLNGVLMNFSILDLLRYQAMGYWGFVGGLGNGQTRRSPLQVH